MAVITLTTDWSRSDYYIGAVKGKLISGDSSLSIIDVSHQISSFNTMQAAFVLKNCYAEFPSGTVHILGVNSVLTPKRSLLIVEKDKHWFLCSDCGFPGLLFPEEDIKVYRVDIEKDKGNTFISLNIFADVALKLSKGKKPEEIGRMCEDYVKQFPLLPTIDKNLINGSVVYVDSYSNAITNINKDTFYRVGEKKSFEIYVSSNHYIIHKISKSYADATTGELVAIFNSADLLEVAVVNGPAAQLLNLKSNSPVRIKFLSEQKDNNLLLSGD